MAVNKYQKDYITFAGGLNSDTNFVKENENDTAKVLDNFYLNKDGSIEKRGGYLTNDSLINHNHTTITKPNIVKWSNPDNTGLELYVVHQENNLYFYDAQVGIKTEGLIGSYNISTFLVQSYIDEGKTSFKVNMYTDGKHLLVVGKYITPLAITWNSGLFQPRLYSVDIKIRDYNNISNLFTLRPITTLDDIPGGNYFQPLDLDSNYIYSVENNGSSLEEQSDNLDLYGTPQFAISAKISWGVNDNLLGALANKDNENDGTNVDKTTTTGGSGWRQGGSKIIKVGDVQKIISNTERPITINSNNTVSIANYNDQLHICINTPRPETYPVNNWFTPRVEQEAHNYYFPKNSNDLRAFGAPIGTYETPLKLKTDIDLLGDSNPDFFYFRDGMLPGNNIDNTYTYSQIDAFVYKDRTLFVNNTGLLNEYTLCYHHDNTNLTPTDLQNFVETFFENATVNDTFNVEGTLGNAGSFYAVCKFSIEVINDNISNSITKTISPSRTAWYDLIYQPDTISLEMKEIQIPVASYTSKLVWEYPNATIVGSDNFTPTDFSCIFLDDNTLKIVLNPTRVFAEGYDYPYPEDDPNYGSTITFNLLRDRLHPNKQGEEFPDQQIDNDWVNLNTLEEYTQPFLDTVDILGYDECFAGLKFWVSTTTESIIQYSQEEYRPEVGAFFAGRAWYTGWNSEYFSNYIFYSKLAENLYDFAQCYSANDPNDEDNNVALATDGGYLVLNDKEKIRALIPYKDFLVVFSDKTCSIVYGDPYFAGDNVNFKKLGNIGIMGHDAYSIVNDKLIFASEAGIYSLIVNDNGGLEIINLTKDRLNNFYTSLTKEQKQNIKMFYNKFTKRLYIMFNTDTLKPADQYDTHLIYDLDLDAFFTHSLGLYADYNVVDFQEPYFYNEEAPLRLLVWDNITGDYGSYYQSNNTYRDFSINNTPLVATLESNYINYGSIENEKRLQDLFVYVDNTEEGSCNAYVKYDTSIIDNKEWSRPHNIYRNQEVGKNDVHEHRQACRGEGIFLRIRFEGSEDKPVKILGFSTNIIMKGSNTQ